MLAQATKQIQKLMSEKSSIEIEHNKLLESNVEMAEELKILYLEEKKWRQTEKVLINIHMMYICIFGLLKFSFVGNDRSQ